MTWAEFQSLTLPEYEALEERRMVQVRYARFNAALIASIVFNAHCGPESESISPFDFIAGLDDSEANERAERRKVIRRGMAQAMLRLPLDAIPEQVADTRAKIISAAEAEGFDDAADIYQELFPE